MKKRPISKTNKSAVMLLTSAFIIAANNPAIQQAFALLALMTFTLHEVAA